MTEKETPIVPEHHAVTAEILAGDPGKRKWYLENISKQGSDLKLHTLFHNMEEKILRQSLENKPLSVRVFDREITETGLPKAQAVDKIIATFGKGGVHVKAQPGTTHINETTGESYVDFLFSF